MNGLQHDRSIALETQDAPCAARNPKVDANYGVDLGGPITKQFEQTMIAQLEANPSDVFRIVLGYQLLSQLLSQRPLLLSNVAIALQRMNTPASTAQYEKLFEVLMAKAGDAQNVPQLNEVTATLARSQTSSREVIVLHEKCIITISSQRVSRDVIDLCLTQGRNISVGAIIHRARFQAGSEP
eukprot:Protomagalhaensia_sp_Gyna_25__3735@NODE_3358_length_608_cov_3_690685_g2815_i0_p1_GENE_NODE_3358_length_608_cov_3_690685_g2815_i0NODE_3358_length_608_cov_3_690685_g2815_i0_p1_ORF_typecomplete_len183_score7_67Peptidase_C30/PF05409_13/0_15_NODE_3358_length_608_cov_3_690685_g2815_i031579